MSLIYADQQNPIVRGGAWPAGGGTIEVTLTRTDAAGVPVDWPADADEWDWTFLVSREQLGGTPEMEVSAEVTSLSTNIIVLAVLATSDETVDIAGTSEKRYFAEIKSDPGGGADASFYGLGYAWVRSAIGAAVAGP
jgi:hypothetical protein